MIYQRNDGQLVDGYPHAFGVATFRELERLLLERDHVVPLREIAAQGDQRDPQTIGMRHDVDHNLEHALKFAHWEHERGIRSTYFVLHTAWYWGGVDFHGYVDELRRLGHEVGLHTNAVAYARDDGADPGHKRAASLIDAALHELRRGAHDVVGTAAHGDIRCDTHHVHNNDLWVDQGGAYQLVDFGLEYEAYFLHRPNLYISDSGGRWSDPLRHVDGKQTSMLIHPCHWDIDAELNR